MAEVTADPAAGGDSPEDPAAESRRRWRPGPLELAALGVVALRLLALMWKGPDRHLPYFDEGPYFSAAALLSRGFLPYRDAALAHHPPPASRTCSHCRATSELHRQG